MKKIIIALLLVTFIATSAFAYHPSGWGIGIMARQQFEWDGFGRSWGAALSLKAPQFPIYWGISTVFQQDAFRLNITGDRYLIDELVLEDINLGWNLGLGAYFGLQSASGWGAVNFGGRVPIGLYIFPVHFLELFANLVPSVGVGIYYGDFPDRVRIPVGDLGFELGLRFWL